MSPSYIHFIKAVVDRYSAARAELGAIARTLYVTSFDVCEKPVRLVGAVAFDGALCLISPTGGSPVVVDFAVPHEVQEIVAPCLECERCKARSQDYLRNVIDEWRACLSAYVVDIDWTACESPLASDLGFLDRSKAAPSLRVKKGRRIASMLRRWAASGYSSHNFDAVRWLAVNGEEFGTAKLFCFFDFYARREFFEWAARDCVEASLSFKALAVVRDVDKRKFADWIFMAANFNGLAVHPWFGRVPAIETETSRMALSVSDEPVNPWTEEILK